MGKQPQNYTNAQLGEKLDGLIKIVQPMVPQVKELMDDKHDRELIAKYLAANPPATPSPPSQPPQQEQLVNQQLLKYLGIALGIISAMVILYGQLKGVAVTK